MIKKILTRVVKLLFYTSFIVAFSIDAYYKFDVPDGAKGYNLALTAYIYFCSNLALLLCRKILGIPNRLIKLLIYFGLWSIPVLTFIYLVDYLEGLLGTVALIIVITTFFGAVFITLHLLFKIRKILIITSFSLILLGTFLWFLPDIQNNANTQKKDQKTKESPQSIIQPWQLNSRYKITGVVKFIKTDLDKDGKDELAAITIYDKIPDTVFYYAGFYRYNPVSEVWDEFYSDELNIFNYGLAREIDPEKFVENSKKLIKMWSTEFTKIENIGDVTGDGSPEIVFSALVQGKYFDNNIIVAQSGKSHFKYKIFSDLNTSAKVIAEDGLLIEKYQSEDKDIKDIYEWDASNLRFKLIESQKSKIAEPTSPPKTIPGLEELSS